jgi:hypothetical protein
MNVWLLWDGVWEPQLVGVFATKEIAEARAEEIINTIPMKHHKRMAARRLDMEIYEELVIGTE